MTGTSESAGHLSSSSRSHACHAPAGNPIFGLTVGPADCTTPYYPVLTTTDRLADELFGDREPLRSSMEAAKRLVTQMEPQYDQVGFVGFNGSVTFQAELACLRRQTVLGDPAACYTGPSPISFTNVLTTIELQVANGDTDIAEGLRNGLEMLGYNVDNRAAVDNLCDGSPNSACGRGFAARPALILLTNGSPNANPGGACDNYPDLWPDGDADFDCVIYYARKAHQAGVTIYTVGLGPGVAANLLGAVATETGGQYYAAPSIAALDLALDSAISSAIASCPAPSLDMAPDGAQTALPQQSVVYTHILTNHSYYPTIAVLTYTAAPGDWAVSISPSTQALEAGQAATVTAMVSAPADSLVGVTHVTHLSATVQEDETISATATDTTTVGGLPPVYLPIVLKGG